MIRSMTAFVRKQDRGEWGNATWELRTVNHRYFEISFRLPESVRDLEPKLRELSHHYAERGKLEVNLRFQPGMLVGSEIIINESLVNALQQAAQRINELTGQESSLRSADILRWPGVVDVSETDLDIAKKALLKLFEQALIDLQAARAREGAATASYFTDRLSKMQQQVDQVSAIQDEIVHAQRNKLKQRVADLSVQLDAQRLEQEIAIIAQKIDVAEELQRLQTHITEVTRILEKGGVIGRQLDFLMQELNREANTLSSKSVDTRVTKAAVELKVLIEQMREQVQNIE